MNILPEPLLNQIILQAEREYPSECCGLILGSVNKEESTRAVPVRNAQDEYHAKDPEQFPNVSRSAYWMDPKDLLNLQKEIRVTGEEIKIIYHSHIDAGAYFSQEDKRMALCDGEPAYPDVKYLVLSVLKGRFQIAVLFQWNTESKNFEAVKF